MKELNDVKKVRNFPLCRHVSVCLAGDQRGGREQQFNKTGSGNEDHRPPGEVNVISCRSPTAKPKPAAKLEKIPKAPHANTSWVSGDYYWDGDNWQWDGGYWLDNPWSEAAWMPGHWNERWWAGHGSRLLVLSDAHV